MPNRESYNIFEINNIIDRRNIKIYFYNSESIKN